MLTGRGSERHGADPAAPQSDRERHTTRLAGPAPPVLPRWVSRKRTLACRRAPRPVVAGDEASAEVAKTHEPWAMVGAARLAEQPSTRTARLAYSSTGASAWRRAGRSCGSTATARGCPAPATLGHRWIDHHHQFDRGARLPELGALRHGTRLCEACSPRTSRTHCRGLWRRIPGDELHAIPWM